MFVHSFVHSFMYSFTVTMRIERTRTNKMKVKPKKKKGGENMSKEYICKMSHESAWLLIRFRVVLFIQFYCASTNSSLTENVSISKCIVLAFSMGNLVSIFIFLQHNFNLDVSLHLQINTCM